MLREPALVPAWNRMFPIVWLRQPLLMLNVLAAALVGGSVNYRKSAAVVLLQLVLVSVHWYTLVAALELGLVFVHLNVCGVAAALEDGFRCH